MKKMLVFIFLLYCLQSSAQLFSTIDGSVHFISDAPLEIIEANSMQLQGLLDLDKKSFAFKIYIKSFEGFNSPLQQVHFYENYMEVKDYPEAVFKGKILESLHEGKGKYRAKGILMIHGESVERIINLELDITENTIFFTTFFLVPLEDHEIDLPRIVYQKIAEEIKVEVSGKLILRE
jgi:hypothetical protein